MMEGRGNAKLQENSLRLVEPKYTTHQNIGSVIVSRLCSAVEQSSSRYFYGFMVVITSNLARGGREISTEARHRLAIFNMQTRWGKGVCSYCIINRHLPDEDIAKSRSSIVKSSLLSLLFDGRFSGPSTNHDPFHLPSPHRQTELSSE